MSSFQTSSPRGAYYPSSPQNTTFKGRIPKIFLLGGIPLLLFFSVYQYTLLKYYTAPQVPRVLKRARARNFSTATLDRLYDVHAGGMDEFGHVAASIQNGSLRTIKKTLKDLEIDQGKKGRNAAAKQMFDAIMAEIEQEVQNIDVPATEAERNGKRLKKPELKKWVFGPVVKPSEEWPKSTVLTGKNKKHVMEVLEWEYNILEKEIPFVGSERDLAMHPNQENSLVVDRKYTNSLVVAPWATETRKHGLIGVNPADGRQWWNPTDMPKICTEVSEEECTKRLKEGGGFDLTISNAKPLDTIPPINNLPDVCNTYVRSIDTRPLPDASVVITFYNEPISTLLRTVHSVLNNTPPSLLREVILVDDHGDLEDNLPGGPLDEAIKFLPKVKILRQPERRGLVMGRIAGIQNSLGTVSIILDSHVEVNEYWIEPMLQRILEEPKAVVYPIIAAIDQKTFEPSVKSGIGTWLSWTWQMVEASTYAFPPTSPDPVPSASMAGGLFAVRRDIFFEFGGYDEQMAMWGAENVEMPFRVWQCGGRVEGIPCSLTYHIYRKGGVGYKSPGESVMMNRLRTARLWMDEWYQIARFFILFGKADEEKENRIIGNMDEMLTLKNDLKCKNFKWFLENIDPKHAARNLDDVVVMGAIRSLKQPTQCLDMHQKTEILDLVGTYNCHGEGSSQSFFSAPNAESPSTHSLVSAMNPKHCVNRIHPLDENMKQKPNFGKAGITACTNHGEEWNLHDVEFRDPPANVTMPKVPADLAPNSFVGRLIQTDANHPEYGKRCLTKVDDQVNVPGNLSYDTCDDSNIGQWWWIQKPDFGKNYSPPTVSPAHLDYLKPFNL